MDTVGNRIRESRKTKGLLLRQLAAILDMDVAILSKIERGERTPTKQQLQKIASALTINETELANALIAESIINELSSNENPIEILKIVQKELKKSK